MNWICLLWPLGLCNNIFRTISLKGHELMLADKDWRKLNYLINFAPKGNYGFKNRNGRPCLYGQSNSNRRYETYIPFIEDITSILQSKPDIFDRNDSIDVSSPKKG